MRARLSVAVVAALVVVGSGPFIGELRAAIQAALPGQYRTVVIVAVAAAIGTASLSALVRMRDRRLARSMLVASALVTGAAYARATSTGNPEVDAVEAFHFVEYGALSVLFHRVWKDREDAGALVFPVLAGLTVGTLDEAFQWFVPARIGELHDVALNGAAAVCGLLFALGLDPPARIPPLDAGALRSLAHATSVVTVVLALFVATVHLGHEIADPQVGRFRSRFTAADLRREAADRSRRWRDDPPAVLRRVSREDQYLAEGIWHIQRRNEALSEGDAWTAWQENVLLETYFAPVLDVPSFLTPAAARWPAEQKGALLARVARRGDGAAFLSTAPPVPIYTWSRSAVLSAALTAAVLAQALARLPATHRTRP